MSRGRPKGSGIRWTPFAEATLWARMQFLRWRDGLDVHGAARRLAHEGYFQARDGKYWLTRDPKEGERNTSLIRAFVGRARPGDGRNFDLAEQFRTRFHRIEKRLRDDPELRERCEFWLRFEKENYRVEDSFKAFENVVDGIDGN